MSALGHAYKTAGQDDAHFIAVDAALFISMNGSTPDLVNADMTAYRQLCNMADSSNIVEIIALNKEEGDQAMMMLAYMAKKTGRAPQHAEVKLVDSVKEGGPYSVLVTARPDAFQGKLDAYSVSYPQSAIFQRHFSR